MAGAWLQNVHFKRFKLQINGLCFRLARGFVKFRRNFIGTVTASSSTRNVHAFVTEPCSMHLKSNSLDIQILWIGFRRTRYFLWNGDSSICSTMQREKKMIPLSDKNVPHNRTTFCFYTILAFDSEMPIHGTKKYVGSPNVIDQSLVSLPWLLRERTFYAKLNIRELFLPLFLHPPRSLILFPRSTKFQRSFSLA